MDAPNKYLDGVPSFKIFSDGTEIGSRFGLISFFVRKEVNRIGKAMLIFKAGEISDSQIQESDDNTFAPGKNIAIHAGYGNDTIPIFEGIVIAHELKIQSKNDCTLKIDCRDCAYQTTQVRRDEIFQNKKDSEVISEILQKYRHLSTSVDSTTIKHQTLFQKGCSDWDFILSRAQANGLFIFSDGNNIAIKKPDLNGKPVLTVTYGQDIIEFEGKLSVSGQIDKIKVQAWDAKEQKMKVMESQDPQLNEQGNTNISELAAVSDAKNEIVSTIGYTDEAELQAMADSRVLRNGLSRIRGLCKFYGNAEAIPGKLLKLEGLGERFCGNAYIGAVEHEFDEKGWVTSVEMGVNPEDITIQADLSVPPAAGLLPAIHGLHIAKVSQIDKDPEGEYKVMVTIPSLTGSSCNTIWARLASSRASNSYGTFFIPDVDDEVVLGFFNNDPRFPVVIGCLYSSKQNPPYEIEAENKISAFVSKSQMKIEFEEEKKIITISTPGNNKIILDDDVKGITIEDQNKNKIVMDDNGILIDSAKGITIKSKADIEADSSANINLKAKSNVAAQGQNVDMKANVALTAKGTAKVEVSASGQTILKGAMVMIN